MAQMAHHQMLRSDSSGFENNRLNDNLGFPGGLAGKESTWRPGDLGLIPGLGRSPGVGVSGLENSMDCIVHGVAKSLTILSDFTFHFRSRLLKLLRIVKVNIMP